MQIIRHNVAREFADEVAPGDPREITNGKQIHFDSGAVGCDDQHGNVL